MRMTDVIQIRNENNQLSKMLNKENQEIYTDIVCYLRVSELSDMQQEEVITDILRMLLDWEKQGKTVRDMIGEDYKKFADDNIAAINPKKTILHKIKEYGIIAAEAFCYLLTVDFIFLFLPKVITGNMPLKYDYSLYMAVSGFLFLIVGVTTVNYIGKNSFSLSKHKISKPVRFLIGGCAGLFIVLILLLAKTFDHIVLVSVDIRYIIVFIALFWVYKAIRGIRAKKQLTA
jgi:DNA-binding ferritin-like protein (Dps family)